MQRRDDAAPVAPGILGFFGGHMEAGENPDECVRRELAEETSLDVPGLIFSPVRELIIPASADYSSMQFYIYQTNIETDDFDVFEGKGAESYTPAELLARSDVSEVVRRILEQNA